MINRLSLSEERTETKNEKGEVTSWRDDSDWRKVGKNKNGRGRVTNLSDKARRETEKLTQNRQKKADDAAKRFMQGMAEGLNEFALGNGGGESGRWYTDDQMTDIVGDGWYQDLDVSGDIPKQQMIQQAQAWLADQGYSVQVLNCKVNDDDMEWYIEGSFQNSGFAKKGMAEAQLDELSKDTIKNYVKAQPTRIKGPTGLATTNPKKAARIVDTEKGDIRRALTKLKDPAYGQQGVAEGGMYGDEEVSWEKGGTRAPTGAFRNPAVKKVVFSGTGDDGGKYEVIQSGPDDYMIHANGKHIDTYSSLQRAMSVLKNEVSGLKKSVDEESKGLWANIHAKRDRIKHGSGEKMRKPGSKGAPTADALRKSAK